MGQLDTPSNARRKVAFDFAALWDDCVRQDSCHWLKAEDDLAFWERHASVYDQRTGGPGSAARTVQLIRRHTRPNDTILDVGAGTGRLALPLSHHVREVTALDHSPHMLDVLSRNAAAWRVQNIRAVQADWADWRAYPHDIVIAAWSLYRQPRLLDTMQKLVDATRRWLFIVTRITSWPPHRLIAGQIWPERFANQVDMPAHLSFLGALWQLGAHADLRILQERRMFSGRTPTDLAALLAPTDASAAELICFAEHLMPHLRRSQCGFVYRVVEPVAVILWRADESHRRIPASDE